MTDFMLPGTNKLYPRSEIFSETLATHSLHLFLFLILSIKANVTAFKERIWISNIVFTGVFKIVFFLPCRKSHFSNFCFSLPSRVLNLNVFLSGLCIASFQESSKESRNQIYVAFDLVRHKVYCYQHWLFCIQIYLSFRGRKFQKIY